METEILDIFSLEDTEVQPAVEKRFIAEIDLTYYWEGRVYVAQITRKYSVSYLSSH